MTMQVIQHIEVPSTPQASFLFSSIPATYDDLLVTVSARMVNSGNIGGYIKLNGVQNTLRILFGTGSGVTSDTGNLTSMGNASSWTANTFSNVQIYIPNYLSSAQKSFSFDAVTENNATAAYQAIAAGLVNTTSAVTSLEIYSADTSTNGYWVQYSSATLYGIKKGSDGTTTVS